MTTVYVNGAKRFGMYAFNLRGDKMVRVTLSVSRIIGFSAMAKYEPITLAGIRSKSNKGVYHNAQWLRKRGA